MVEISDLTVDLCDQSIPKDNLRKPLRGNSRVNSIVLVYMQNYTGLMGKSYCIRAEDFRRNIEAIVCNNHGTAQNSQYGNEIREDRYLLVCRIWINDLGHYSTITIAQ